MDLWQGAHQVLKGHKNLYSVMSISYLVFGIYGMVSFTFLKLLLLSLE